MAQSYALKKEATGVPVSRGDYLAPLVIVILLTAAVFIGFFHLRPPAEALASAPAPEFSASRAVQHLQEIAQKPHPVGSSEHARVRDYIVGQLSALGLNPQVQKSSALKRSANGSLSGATVENISANIEGSSGAKSVLLAAHYDSVATSPGASDDGTGVAALLETARALKARPQLKNRVILLFTDAEEIGLLGAKAFIDEDPRAKDLGVVLNFDVRGSSGPSIMFETSSRNGQLIDEFAKAAPYPLANSVTYEVYKRLPNDNDFSVFKGAGLAGLNFAYIDGLNRYHSARDDIGNVDRRSLQHHGSYAVALASHFGDLDLNQISASDQIYFSTVASTVVRYSKTFALALAVGELLIFLFVATLGFKKKLVSIRGVLLGIVAFAVCLAVCSGVVALVWQLMKMLHGQYRSMPNGVPYNSQLYFVGFVALTLAIFTALYALYAKKVSVHNLSLSILLVWTILTLLVTLLMPGASYLFAWPLLFGLIAAGWLFSADGKTPVSRAAALSLLAVPGILLFVPVIYLLFVSMTLEMSWLIAAVEVLLLSLLVQHLNMLAGLRRWLPLAAVVVAVGAITMAAVANGVDQSRPKVNSIFYALNSDSGKAVWASYEQRADEWTSQFLGQGATRGSLSEYFPINSPNFLRVEAQPLPLEPPSVTVLEQSTQNGVRTLHLRLSSVRGAQIISASVEPTSGVVAQVNGKPVNASLDGGWGIRYYGAGQEGVDLILQLNSTAPIKIGLVDTTYGLPQAGASSYRERPDYMIPSQLPLSDSTLVSKSFTF